MEKPNYFSKKNQLVKGAGSGPMKNKVYKYFKNCNHVADNVMKNGILLGCHHGMSISDVNTICKIFLKFLNK